MTISNGAIAIHQRSEVCRECGKTIYRRKRTALKKIKERDRRSVRKVRGVGPVHAYLCPHGNGWHTGHTAKTALREPRERPWKGWPDGDESEEGTEDV